MTIDERAESAHAERLGAAYDIAVGVLAAGAPAYAPSRDVRRAMIRAMIAEGRERGFGRDDLVLAAIAAARRLPNEQGKAAAAG